MQTQMQPRESNGFYIQGTALRRENENDEKYQDEYKYEDEDDEKEEDGEGEEKKKLIERRDDLVILVYSPLVCLVNHIAWRWLEHNSS